MKTITCDCCQAELGPDVARVVSPALFVGGKTEYVNGDHDICLSCLTALKGSLDKFFHIVREAPPATTDEPAPVVDTPPAEVTSA
jgi:hypothetical protein